MVLLPDLILPVTSNGVRVAYASYWLDEYGHATGSPLMVMLAQLSMVRSRVAAVSSPLTVKSFAKVCSCQATEQVDDQIHSAGGAEVEPPQALTVA